MSPKKPVERPVSAGGVVVRVDEGGAQLVLCGWRSPRLWALPKGTPDSGETLEQTAIREVTEETGVEVETKGLIDSIQYWFVRSSDGVRCHKTVYFYLMAPTGGDVSRHDHEFDEVRWFPAVEALKSMTYGSEAEIAEKGISMASG